jgi:hypothetical protein
MKPVKIGQKDSGHLKYCLRSSEERLNEVITAVSLSAFGLPHNMEVVSDILSGGNNSRLKLLETIENEAGRSNIPMVQEQTRKNLLPLIRLFDEFVSKAKEAISYELKGAIRVIDYIEVTDIQIRFNEKAQAAIDEHCSIYIDTEEQMKVYDAATEAAKALNKLQKMVEPFGLNALGEMGIIDSDLAVSIEAMQYCKPDGLFVRR